MPSRVGYSASHEWIRALLKPLRVPIVFVLSGLASFCAFQDSSAVMTGNALSTARAGDGAVRLALWDADLMPRGERLPVRLRMSQSFADSVNPDVVVLYDVPSFAQLLKLRDALGLYGYTAVMSNFFCGKVSDAVKWPIEVAVLSRYPISDATQFDPTTGQTEGCTQSAPSTDGPVIASHRQLRDLHAQRVQWPQAGGAKDAGALPGPGILTVRIDSIHVAIAAVHVPSADKYPDADPLAVNAMRQAIAAAAQAWIAKSRAQLEDYQFLAMGDFGLDPGVESAAQEAAADAANVAVDSIDARYLSGGKENGKDDPQAINLTADLLADGAPSGVFPHSDRIYLWPNGSQSFGPARRADNSYGSRAFPLIVRSSGAGCTVDPHLVWMRHGPTFTGFARQVFSASDTALAVQLQALRTIHPDGTWVVTLNLDNVVIDSSKFLYQMALNCRLPGPDDWRDWVRSDRPTLMPGAGGFLRRLRAQAAGEGGHIILFTKLSDDLRGAITANLTRLGVMAGESDPIIQLDTGATPQSRDTVWHEATAKGARLVLVMGSDAKQFPDDPQLPVGGTPDSCPNKRADDNAYPNLFGTQTARFGICYFLIPGHVL